MARSDLNKLLCERERPRSKDKFKYYRNSKFVKEFDGHLLTRGMIYGWNAKEFNENLNPLYGFVQSRVGQNWDEVYSELCKVFDKRSVINQHILTHLFQYVETNAYEQDGKILVLLEYGYGSDRRIVPIEESGSDYFVHPVTKVLTKNNKNSYRQIRKARLAREEAEKMEKERVFDDGRKVRKVNGCWFFYWTETKDNSYRDAKTGKLCEQRDVIEHQRQCSKKELKHYRLR